MRRRSFTFVDLSPLSSLMFGVVAAQLNSLLLLWSSSSYPEMPSVAVYSVSSEVASYAAPAGVLDRELVPL